MKCLICNIALTELNDFTSVCNTCLAESAEYIRRKQFYLDTFTKEELAEMLADRDKTDKQNIWKRQLN